MKKANILIVDDEKRIRQVIRSLLEKNDFSVSEAADGIEGLEKVEQTPPDLILLDMKMPGMDGMAMMSQLVEQQFTGKILVLTAFGSIENAVEAVKKGAYDYITKPFVSQDLLQKIRRALKHQEMELELDVARKKLDKQYGLEGIITAHPRMFELFELVRRVAETNAPVLITGESGTGKELFARAIHKNSPRHQQPFVAINASALPESLIESELFGHEKGAFTGAHASKPGLLAKADGGTLFLDEISEMPFNLQAKLLRFTQSGEFIPVGGRQIVNTDVRLISATNKKMPAEIEAQRFRQDLYYRLKVVLLEIPPLRERKEDIIPLANHFSNKYSDTAEAAILTDEAKRLLLDYNWPGNVRELENTIRGALAISKDNILSDDALPTTLTSATNTFRIGEESSLESARNRGEKQIISEALTRHNGNRTHTAKSLGVSRVTLLKKIKKYELD